jgi:serine/threonine protein kinase
MKGRLGRYQIIHRLAAGGMGEIYIAEHTGLSGFAKRVALKRITKDLADNQSYVELFLNEARIGSFLNHPNIVHIFDVGHEKENLWLVMEYVDGVDLKRLHRRAKLAGKPLAPPVLAAIMAEVLSALEEAHAGGPFRGEPIIHRDISPENVLVARSGAVKVLDFGLAKWLPGRESVPSMEGNMIFGKIRYMPPEQLRGKDIDRRSDLFAVGVVMYELLAGKLPFGHENANAVLRRILDGPPLAPTAASGERDPAIDAIVLKAIRPNPEDRYQDANEMRTALIEYLTGTNLALPFEILRRMLHPDSTLGSDASTEIEAELSEHGVTEIALGVAKRCGKCGGEFRSLFIEGLIIDRCSSCRGVWLDHGEVERLLESRTELKKLQPKASTRAPLDVLVGSCPNDRVALRAFNVPGHPAAIEVCPMCHGVWFDKGELRLLREDDVHMWLGTLLDALRSAAAPDA